MELNKKGLIVDKVATSFTFFVFFPFAINSQNGVLPHIYYFCFDGLS